MVGPVDQGDRGAGLAWVAAGRRVEYCGDDGAASATTLAVSHLPLALGPWLAASLPAWVAGRMSARVRATGVASCTAPTSAMRLRQRFSPFDGRLDSLGRACPAAANWT